MQKVDEYIRHAKRYRDLAAQAAEADTKQLFQLLADEWESLSKERLAFLELRVRRTPGTEGSLV